jgi:hypothetical protein
MRCGEALIGFRRPKKQLEGRARRIFRVGQCWIFLADLAELLLESPLQGLHEGAIIRFSPTSRS